MGRIAALLVLLAGCHRTPESRCINLAMKVGARLEKCGLAIKISRERAKIQWDGFTDAERKAWVDRNLYIDEGENCEALRLRLTEVNRRLMEEAIKKDEEDAKKQAESEFQKAFKEALEEGQRTVDSKGDK